MTPLLVLGAWTGVTVALAGVLTLAVRRCLGNPPYRIAAGIRRPALQVPERRPLQEVAADLRRLARELAAVPAGAPFVRWQALQVAYDRVLAEAAETLEVEHVLPDLPIGSARDIERLRVVCALESAGLVVQD